MALQRSQWREREVALGLRRRKRGEGECACVCSFELSPRCCVFDR